MLQVFSLTVILNSPVFWKPKQELDDAASDNDADEGDKEQPGCFYIRVWLYEGVVLYDKRGETLELDEANLLKKNLKAE